VDKKDQEIKGREYEATKMVLRKNFILKAEFLSNVCDILEKFIETNSHLLMRRILN
jgi:uncharacterized tellurite resistance protein B-like protein